MKHIGHLIRQLRTERKLSQDELAARLGVTKQTISNYERDFRQPDYDGLVAICDVLNVPMAFFLTDRERNEELARIYATYPSHNPAALVSAPDLSTPTSAHDSLRSTYAQEGIAAHEVKKPEPIPKKKAALDEIIDRLAEYRDHSSVLSPDEKILLDLYRHMTAKTQAKARKILEQLCDF